MEWVEVRGETLEAAKEEALDQLGVALEDAEFEIVQEAESRWMGLKKTEARVRARVRPTQPRPKNEGNRGGRRARGRDGQGESDRSRGRGQGGESRDRNNGSRSDRKRSGPKDSSRDGRGDGGTIAASANRDRPDRDPAQQKAGDGARGGRSRNATKKETNVDEDNRSDELVPIEEQQTMVSEFLEGIVTAFDMTATVSTDVDDGTIIGSINGDDLGLLIGPQGGTLRAIQELSRSALQRQAGGLNTSRLRVDVAGYRERRRAALAAFAQRQAEKVLDEGVEVALEPMGSADRKAIHDAILEVDGVRSISEGDEPHRRVVLLPDND